MSYERQYYTNGDVLDARQMNHMETGIKENSDNIDKLSEELVDFGIANLFDKSKTITGIRLTISGADYSQPGYFTSEYIEVTADTWYYLNFVCNDMVRVCTYDENKNFLSIYNSFQIAVKTDSNAKYIRFCDVVENTDADMITKESFVTRHDLWYVTPEQFGAYGNGVKNDHDAIQNAIDYCVANGYTLKFHQGKTYGIGSVLNLSNTNGLIIDFNWATIKALSVMDYMFEFDGASCSNNTKTVLTNIKADCNGLSGFLNLIYSFKFTLDNFLVTNCKKTAFYVQEGGAFICQNGTVVGDCSSGSIGINMRTSDCHFEEIVLVDMMKCIFNDGTNFYHKVHGWLTGNVSGSIFFEHFAGFGSLVQCQCDTYEVGYFIRTDNVLSLVACTYYNNSVLYDSDVTPICFKYNTNIHFFADRTCCTNCSFNSPNLEAKIAQPSDAKITFNGYTYYNNINGADKVGKIIPSLVNCTTDFASAFNEIAYKSDGMCHFDIFAKLNADMMTPSGFLQITTLYSPYNCKKKQTYPCYMTKTENGSDCIIGKLVIDTDNTVKVRIPNIENPEDYPYFYAHAKY